MSGIERHRIVGKSEEELDELMCSICQDIVDDPVVTKCCRLTFCSFCITQWLNNNKSCPIDRQRMQINELIPAPRMVINLISRLSIKCTNYQDCKTILTIEEMKNHIKTCGKTVCNSCEELSNVIKVKDHKIQILEEKNNSLEKEITNLKQQLIQLKNISSRQRGGQRDAIESFRKNQDYRITYIFELSEDDKTFLINESKRSLRNYLTFNEICKDMHDKINDNHNLRDLRWVVIIELKNSGLGQFLLCTKGLHIEFEEFIIKMYGLNKVLQRRIQTIRH